MPTELLQPNSTKLSMFGSVENKELTEKELFRRIKPVVGEWASRCFMKKLQAPYDTFTYRTVTYPKAPHPEEVILQEGVRPDPRGRLIFSEHKVSIKPRGFYEEFTDRELEYGFDNIVGEKTNSVALQAKGVVNALAANAFLSGNNVVTASEGLTREIFNKIRISLHKFTIVKNPKIYAVLTPEDITDLRLKYNKAGSNLFLDIPANERSIIDGTIARFEGVDIVEDASECLYDGTKRKAIFYCVDNENRLPVCLISPNGEQGEMVEKPLGSSGVNDPLNQVGSIGVKFKGLGAYMTSEETVVRVEITPASDGIGYVDSGYYYDQVGGKHLGGDFTPKNSDGTKVTVAAPKALILSSTKAKITVATGSDHTATISAKDLAKDTVTGFTLTSLDTDKATVSGAVVTAVAAGDVVIKATKAGYQDGYITLKVTA